MLEGNYNNLQFIGCYNRIKMKKKEKNILSANQIQCHFVIVSFAHVSLRPI